MKIVLTLKYQKMFFSIKTMLCIGTFLLLVSINDFISAQTLQSSVDLLTPRDTSIGLNCFIGKSKVNKWTTFRFTVQGKEIYNSKTNKKAPGVTVLNQTSITYSQISAGLVQAVCYVNSSRSTNTLTVSSFKSLTQTITLTGGVSVATIGRNVSQKCTQVTVPNVGDYVLNYLKDGKVIGQWTVKGSQKTFSTPNKVSGLQVLKGNTSATFSSVALVATSMAANGVYQCQFVLGKYSSTSGAWHGKFSPPTPTTTTKKAMTTKAPTTSKPTTKPTKPTTKSPTTKHPQTTPTKMPPTKPPTTKPPTTKTPTTKTPTKGTTSNQTTETPKETTTPKSEPTKPKTTTSHHHHHSTTPKHHHSTTTHKPSAGTSVQISATFTCFAALTALFVLLFAY